ncbi:hypothetical protein [Paludibaculum fermentans]|uniref:hypothetical protein n=1 Tax=Paludibaculum fermentans TaxID=1473598 RepID=UPI003EBC8883
MLKNQIAGVVLVLCALTCQAQSPADELARVLRDKQVITSAEFDRVIGAGANGVQQLAAILRDKGIISATDAAGLHAAPAVAPAPISTAAAAAPKAEAAPSPKLKFNGTLLFNAYFNSAGTNNADFPGFATPRTAGPQENFGATARQTRLGLSISDLKAGNAKLSAVVEADFFGGDPALANGVNMDILRLRLAYGRLQWDRFAIQAGQDWSIFAPLNPTSFAEFSIPEFSGSGNLWIRTPQIRAEWNGKFAHDRTLLWQVAAVNPDIGDNLAAYSTVRQPRAGELGRLPAVETRLALSSPVLDRTATLGFSGHWGTAKNTAVTNGIAATRDFQSWGAAVDYNLPLGRFVTLSGEAFAGRALGIFSGGIGQTVLPIGQPGDRGVGTRGGWAQVSLQLSRRWQSNTAYGIDAPEIGNVPGGGRSKNQSYMSNIIFHLSPNVAFALEWHRFLTNYRNQPASNNIGDHFNLGAAYTF